MNSQTHSHFLPLFAPLPTRSLLNSLSASLPPQGKEKMMMNRWGDSSATAACPNGVVCPKPRRFVSVNEPIYARPVHISNNYQMEGSESRAGTEILDLILTKGNPGAEKLNFQVASSPPFFSGSPPVRASNPVIQDEQFGAGKVMMMSPLSPSMESLSKNGSGGSSGRVKCGNKPAPVRIEGFECRGTAVVA